MYYVAKARRMTRTSDTRENFPIKLRRHPPFATSRHVASTNFAVSSPYRRALRFMHSSMAREEDRRIFFFSLRHRDSFYEFANCRQTPEMMRQKRKSPGLESYASRRIIPVRIQIRSVPMWTLRYFFFNDETIKNLN